MNSLLPVNLLAAVKNHLCNLARSIHSVQAKGKAWGLEAWDSI